MSGEHARVMRLFDTMATAPNEAAGSRGKKNPGVADWLQTSLGSAGGVRIRRALTDYKMLDLVNSQHRVRREKLVAELRSKSRPPEGSGAGRSSD